jgi:nitrogen fixation/metabolism regulation signal transduction histidine kinase
MLIIILVVLASVISARALVQPLRELKEATDRISRGDLTVELNIRSNDEIGELADSFERMVAAIKFFREQSQSGDEEEDSERAPESGSGEP